MPEPVAHALLSLLAVHLALGVVFAASFLGRGVERLDPGARGSGWGFRLAVLPGVVALWPLLWSRQRRASAERRA